MKTNEITRNEFEAEVLNLYGELIEKVANIGVNVTDVITQIYEKNGNWEIDYTIPKVKNYLEKVFPKYKTILPKRYATASSLKVK